MSQSERAVAFADIKDGVAYFMQAHVLPNEHVFEGLANRCRLPALCAAAACASHAANDALSAVVRGSRFTCMCCASTPRLPPLPVSLSFSLSLSLLCMCAYTHAPP